MTSDTQAGLARTIPPAAPRSRPTLAEGMPSIASSPPGSIAARLRPTLAQGMPAIAPAIGAPVAARLRPTLAEGMPTVDASRPTMEGSRPGESLSATDYQFVADVLYRESGLAIGTDKLYLLQARLGAVASAWGRGTLSGLVLALRTEQTLRRNSPRPVTLAVCDALTTNETLFFRDAHPFLALRDSVLPAIARRRQAMGTRTPIRIWCAAASTGQEPYSVAMCAALAAPAMLGIPVEIVGTDYSPRALQRARDGIYSEFEARRGLASDHMTRFFVPDPAGVRISPALRDSIRFERRNLLEPFGDMGTFDVIFCRNVLLYFDVSTKRSVLDRLADSLSPDGVLFLGATETPFGISSRLRRCERVKSTSYERTPA